VPAENTNPALFSFSAREQFVLLSGVSWIDSLLGRHQQRAVERINDAYQKGLAVFATKAVALEPVVIEAGRSLSAK
jgi:hypothetical protein